MNIFMTGIDHHKASVEYREKFSLTKSTQAVLLDAIKNYPDVEGCVILNTCNRMEIWVSYKNACPVYPYDMLCEIKQLDPKQFEAYFIKREGPAAVEHLFELSCGLKSQIFGEEQIITQVRDAIDFARENCSSDAVLESLFRNAVTAAKKVKTQIRLTPVDRSLAVSAVELLKKEFETLSNLNCMVIGNGEMGRLTAANLIKEGCHVMMTLRQYKNNNAVIPVGCEIINYEDRHKFLNKASVIVSATMSPHYTLHFQEAASAIENHSKIFIDLAVPRDIDPLIASLEHVKLFDIDDFGGAANGESANAVRKAKEILNSSIHDFENWYYFRYLVPKINQISEMAAGNIESRIKNKVESLIAEEDKKASLCETVNEAAYKIVEKIMFGFKEDMNRTLWEQCIKSIEKSVSK